VGAFGNKDLEMLLREIYKIVQKELGSLWWQYLVCHIVRVKFSRKS